VIVVVDYGVNNLASVVRALRAAGHESTLADSPDAVRAASRVVVPGVGHFAQASRNLAVSGLGDAIRAAAAAGVPVLGICLGMQLFFEASEEAPGVAGLGILPGQVQRFRTELPVPHVGWALVTPTDAGRRHAALAHLLAGEPPFYYHVHSYHPASVPGSSVYATAEYGETFPTLVGRENVLGAQFHPEKSQAAGQALLDAFARWAP
jgi:imidazole glycerol-phosphate synthase subunit HisH